MSNISKRMLCFNGICFFSSILLGALLSANQSVFHAICAEFQMPAQSGIGIYTALFFGGMAAMSVFSGELCERIGKKAVIAGASFLTALGLVLLASSGSAAMSIVSFLIVGCGFGMIEGQVAAVLVDENTCSSNRISNFNMVFMSLGSIISPLIVSSYLESSGNWRGIYYLAAALFAAIGVIFCFQKFTRIISAPRKREVVSFKLLKKPAFLIACLLIFLYLGAESGATAWTTNFFLEKGSEANGAIALSLFWAAVGVGRFAAGLAGEGEKKHLIIRLGTILAIAGLICMMLVENTTVCIVAYGLAGLGFGPLWASFFALGMDVSGENTGAASGIAMLFSSLGGVVIPMLLGLFLGAAVFWVSAAVLVVMAGLHTVYISLTKKDKGTGG